MGHEYDIDHKNYVYTIAEGVRLIPVKKVVFFIDRILLSFYTLKN